MQSPFPPHPDLPPVWVWITDVPTSPDWPILVERKDGKTLVMIQDGAPRYAATVKCTQLLRSDEVSRIRVAYGQPPVGHGSMAEWLLTGRVSVHTLPDEINADLQQRRVNDTSALGA